MKGCYDFDHEMEKGLYSCILVKKLHHCMKRKQTLFLAVKPLSCSNCSSPCKCTCILNHSQIFFCTNALSPFVFAFHFLGCSYLKCMYQNDTSAMYQNNTPDVSCTKTDPLPMHQNDTSLKTQIVYQNDSDSG